MASIRNIFNMGFHTLRAHLAGVRTTLNVMLSVTNRCPANGAPIVSSRSYLEYLFRWSDYRQPTSSTARGITCRSGSLYCNIDTDGSLYPSSVLVGEMSAPNIREGDLPKRLPRCRKPTVGPASPHATRSTT